MNVRIVIGLLFLILCACKPKQEEVSDVKSTNQFENMEFSDPKGPPTNEQRFEGLPLEQIKYLFETVDYIDYIFFDLPFSMNQSEKSAVQSMVSFISVDAMPAIPAQCKAIGRLVYIAKGEIIKEADFFFSEGCYFWLFVDQNNKPEFASKMTEKGAEFIQKMLGSALNTSQPQPK